LHSRPNATQHRASPAAPAAAESAARAFQVAGRSARQDPWTRRSSWMVSVIASGTRPGTEPEASRGRRLRTNARATPDCLTRTHPIRYTKGLARRPGAYRWCFRDPAEEKKQPRNSLLLDRPQEVNSHRPQGMRRTLPADKGVTRACTETTAVCKQPQPCHNPPHSEC
jgi:hypothetical protein